MTTFVLVPGFWLGAWSWRRVADALEPRGHTVHAVDLTGMGDRADEASPDVDLDTHVRDVVALLDGRDLHDVALVGHSYGGLVTTGAADRVPECVARLVYVDTGPLPDGVSQYDFWSPDEQRANAESVAAYGDGWRLAPPPWSLLADGVEGVDEHTLAELERRSVPQPWATATAPARLTGAWEGIARVGVLSSFTEAAAREMAEQVPIFRHMGGERWTYVELPTWHWPMLSRAQELADALDGTCRS